VWLKSPLPYDTESTACETNPHSVSAWERTPRLSVRKPPPHLLSLITRYVTIIPRESPAGMGKVISLLSFVYCPASYRQVKNARFCRIKR
jgi:hypothetical protein